MYKLLTTPKTHVGLTQQKGGQHGHAWLTCGTHTLQYLYQWKALVDLETSNKCNGKKNL